MKTALSKKQNHSLGAQGGIANGSRECAPDDKFSARRGASAQ
jgi:hypothetical protein